MKRCIPPLFFFFTAACLAQESQPPQEVHVVIQQPAGQPGQQAKEDLGKIVLSNFARIVGAFVNMVVFNDPDNPENIQNGVTQICNSIGNVITQVATRRLNLTEEQQKELNKAFECIDDDIKKEVTRMITKKVRSARLCPAA